MQGVQSSKTSLPVKRRHPDRAKQTHRSLPRPHLRCRRPAGSVGAGGSPPFRHQPGHRLLRLNDPRLGSLQHDDFMKQRSILLPRRPQTAACHPLVLSHNAPEMPQHCSSYRWHGTHLQLQL